MSTHTDNDYQSLFRIFAAWTVSLSPLVPTAVKQRCDEDLMQVCKEEPTWARAWFAGMISTLSATLPTPDPWSNLSAAIRAGSQHIEDVESPSRGQSVVPQETAAVSPRTGALFGSVADGFDLVAPPAHEDIYIDFEYAGITEPLDQKAAAIIGVSKEGFDATLRALTLLDINAAIDRGNELSQQEQSSVVRMFPKDTPKNDHSELFTAGTAAITWLAWRRSKYLYRTDHALQVFCFRWCEFAQDYSTDMELDFEAIATLVKDNKIDDDEYSTLGDTNFI